MANRSVPRAPAFVLLVLSIGVLFLSAGLLVSLGVFDGSDDDNDNDPAVTPTEPTAAGETPTDSATSSPHQGAINIVCPPEDAEADDGFCEFVAEHQSVTGPDQTESLLDRLSGRTVSCTDATDPCTAAGEDIEVIPRTVDDEGADVRVEDARAELADLFDSMDPAASDDRGDGAMSLFAIATGVSEIRDRAFVLTGIEAQGEPTRIALMLQITLHDGDWLITSYHVYRGNADAFMEAIEQRQGAASFWKWQLASTIESFSE